MDVTQRVVVVTVYVRHVDSCIICIATFTNRSFAVCPNAAVDRHDLNNDSMAVVFIRQSFQWSDQRLRACSSCNLKSVYVKQHKI